MTNFIKNAFDLINDPEEARIQKAIHTILMMDEPNRDVILNACCVSILSINYEKDSPLDEIHSICDDLISCTQKAIFSGHCDKVKAKRKEMGLDEID